MRFNPLRVIRTGRIKPVRLTYCSILHYLLGATLHGDLAGAKSKVVVYIELHSILSYILDSFKNYFLELDFQYCLITRSNTCFALIDYVFLFVTGWPIPDTTLPAMKPVVFL